MDRIQLPLSSFGHVASFANDLICLGLLPAHTLSFDHVDPLLFFLLCHSPTPASYPLTSIFSLFHE